MPQDIVNFDWSTPIRHYPQDTLDRAKYATFIHNYLVHRGNNQGYVLNLNAKWGAGKSYFINRWIDSIKDSHPVVYIDAWKQDYSNDPMLTIVSSLMNEFSELLPDEHQAISNIAKKSAHFIKAAAPALIKGLIKKTTGLNWEDIPKNDCIQNEYAFENIEEPAAALTQCLISDHNEKLESIEHLRNEIKLLIEAVVAHNKQFKKTAFIFIDELDRCRPNYAVEMLEVVKHFFELENIIFVIATDTEQLQHAIKAVYGEGFDAQTYLGRFFQRRYSLSQLNRHSFIEHLTNKNVNIDETWKDHVPSLRDQQSFSDIVFNVAEQFQLSLRETEQLLDKFLAVLNNTSKLLNPYLLLILFVLQEHHHNLYIDWENKSNKHQNFKLSIDRINMKIGSFPVSSPINDGYFRSQSSTIFSPNHRKPGRNETKQRFYMNLELDDILTSMNYIFLISHDVNEYPKYFNDLCKKAENEFGHIELAQVKDSCLKRDWLKLNAQKSDYIDWVELAVSFNR